MNTTNHVEHGLKQDYPSLRAPGRATGIPTNVLAAQHRIQRDGSLAFAESFALPFAEGDVIGGKYRVQELIGVGGVGFVVSATHLQLDDSVALKLLKPEFAANPEAVYAFSLEARASFRIKSEHVARVYDVDVLPNGTPFMVMELLRGEDLRTIIKRHRTLPVEFAVDIALQTCEALATAHASGIVHRDVKPENLFVTQAGDTPQIKVLDFGISQALVSSPFRVPGSGGIPTTIAVGTPPYMSPEQIRGAIDLDGRADIWSLGCVLYELLTGFAPFARMSVMQACAAVLEEEPAPIRESRPGVPPSLEVAVMRSLRKAPAQRFADAAELAEALVPYARHAAYCAHRCATLLSKEPPRSSSVSGPPRRVAPPPPPGADVLRLRSSTAHAPVRRLPTNANLAQSGVRRPTLNRVPAAPLARTASIAVAAVPATSLLVRDVGVAAAVVAPIAPAADDEFEDLNLDFVPGLRPRRLRWFVLTASACVVIGLAYMAFVGFDRAPPMRSHVKTTALTAEVDTLPGAAVE